MSAHRCEHGTLVSDQIGEYRCYQCEPIGPEDARVPLLEVSRDRVADAFPNLSGKPLQIEELERVVAQLCERNGIIFDPPVSQ